jgi:hypothetical protein
MKLTTTIIILVVMVLFFGTKIYQTNNYEETILEVQKTFLKENQNSRLECAEKGLNFIGVVINEKGNYESVCNTESPFKIYRFERNGIVEV